MDMMDRRPIESSVRGHHPNQDQARNPHQPNQGMLAAFLPGQRAALADQLNAGFGGGEGQWSGMMGKAYAPIRNAANFRYTGFGGGGGGGGGGHPSGIIPGEAISGPVYNVSGQAQAPLSPEMLALIREKITKQGM